MKKLFAILVIINLMACNNGSDSDTGVSNSTDTIDAAAPVDTNAKISDSVGTKMTTTTTSDTLNK